MKPHPAVWLSVLKEDEPNFILTSEGDTDIILDLVLFGPIIFDIYGGVVKGNIHCFDEPKIMDCGNTVGIG